MHINLSREIQEPSKLLKNGLELLKHSMGNQKTDLVGVNKYLALIKQLKLFWSVIKSILI